MKIQFGAFSPYSATDAMPVNCIEREPHLHCLSTPEMYLFIFVVVTTKNYLFTALSLIQLEMFYATNHRIFFLQLKRHVSQHKGMILYVFNYRKVKHVNIRKV